MIPAGTRARLANRGALGNKSSTTLVVTPAPGPSLSARIECTACPARMYVSGFPLAAVERLALAVETVGHGCSGS